MMILATILIPEMIIRAPGSRAPLHKQMQPNQVIKSQAAVKDFGHRSLLTAETPGLSECERRNPEHSCIQNSPAVCKLQAEVSLVAPVFTTPSYLSVVVTVCQSYGSWPLQQRCIWRPS